MKKVAKTTSPNKKTNVVKTVKTVKKVESNNQMISVYDASGKVVEQIAMPEIFNVKVSDNLLAQYVRVYLSNQRQGTQSTKTRSEVIGSTRKIYKQKGTGRARHGSGKEPTFVGGGVAHAPKPRDYTMKMNSKQRRLALLGAFKNKFSTNDIMLVSGFLNLAKTKQVSQSLLNLKVDTKKVYLVITPTKESDKFILGSRNLNTVQLASAHNLNAYDIMKYKKIVMLKESLSDLEKLYSKHENN